MKKNLLLTTLLIAILGQVVFSQSNMFIRIYDQHGKKIQKGYLMNLTDSSVSVWNAGKENIVPVKEVDKIRTKHSVGHGAALGALIGAVPSTIIGVVTADPDAYLGYTTVEGALYGFVIGATIGATTGMIIELAQKRKEYVVSGSLDQWQEIRPELEKEAGSKSKPSAVEKNL